ncbi:hypothetical protein V3C99_012391 [Haemonchus contortus]
MNTSDLQRKYDRLLHAIPPLPTPTQLYKKIVATCRYLHETLKNMTTLTERIANLRRSREGWKECIAELQIIETLKEKQELEFIFIRTELRTLFAVPPLLIATGAISESNWRAIITQPQYDDRENYILMKQSTIETVIEDQLKILSEQQSLLNDFRRILEEEERMDTQDFQRAVITSLDNLQSTLKRKLEMTAKDAIDDNFAAIVLHMKDEITMLLRENSRIDQIAAAVKEAIRTTPHEHTPHANAPQKHTQSTQTSDNEHAERQRRAGEGRRRPSQESVEGGDPEIKRIRENAEFMEEVMEEEESDDWRREAEIGRRRTELIMEHTDIEEKIEELEDLVYRLDMEPDCEPRNFEMGSIVREDEKGMKCVFCGRVGEHYSDSCTVYRTVAIRKQIVIGEHRCACCLRVRYEPHACKKERTKCYHCHETGHHSALCNWPERAEENKRRYDDAIRKRKALKERKDEIERLLKQLQDRTL